MNEDVWDDDKESSTYFVIHIQWSPVTKFNKTNQSKFIHKNLKLVSQSAYNLENESLQFFF